MHGIAIVGAGNMGRAHAEAWSRLGLGERIRYVCTRRPGASFPPAPSARVVTELDDVLADPDVDIVSICTPTPTHAELAVRALAAGRHVLLEKPVALDPEGAAAIMAADAASDGILMVAHVVRFFAGYERVRAEVASGRIGIPREVHASRSSAAPTSTAWLGDEGQSGGMLVDFAIHDFDQINLHLGRPVAVTTVETGASGRFESRVEYADGGVGHVVTEAQLPAGSPFGSTIEVTGTSGVTSFRYPDAAPDEPFVRQTAYFLDCVDTRRPPDACPPESAVVALRLALAARESLRSGRTIEVSETPMHGRMEPMGILITADELARRLDDERRGRSDGRTVVLDVRWSLSGPDGRPAYLAGHVPGAVYVDLDHELADHSAVGEGRHPLPGEAAFTEAMRGWGLRDGDRVVVTDDSGNQSAARAWWLLRHAGVEDVRMLDGGIDAWSAAGHPLKSGEHVPERGDATARFGGMPVIDLDGAARFPESGVLLDARAAARYRGEVEPIDPRAGHIPGARSAPSGDNLDADGRFLSPELLRERFAALGIESGTPAAVYCGSGITAAHQVAALALAGIDAALYPGSWSQWSNEPDRPVATGAEPR